ncbi:MAG TPA: NADPH-dependent glutamate synthase [Tepiditoga sp.]|nr:NADPH-dependent glutamate synthase [Thermotogota bacterium]HOO73676.1 NADPH-dependent glutamate synthase [Tepiditoga sp.]
MNDLRKKVQIKELISAERNKNFEEVVIGYSEEEAVSESQRCLNCKNPMCVKGCPVNVPIPDFIEKIKERKFNEAYKIIKTENFLPAVCGRVCPQEKQCEGNCIRNKTGDSVSIGKLERFVSDYYSVNEENTAEKNNKKIAVIGSGPAGITCAGELAVKGYEVTVFEALHIPGGVLSYGIPEFRLPKKIVENEIDKIKNLGVKIITNVIIGKSMTIDDLLYDGYDSVFIGSGAGLPRIMGIPGENLKEIYYANEFLTRVNLMKAYKKDSETPIKIGKTVTVIGGGNVAVDSARTAKRLGAEKVFIVYRREEIPAREEEIIHAREEGIEFILLTSPVKFIGENGFVKAVEMVKTKLLESEKSGKKDFCEIEGSNYLFETDTVIIAAGQTSNPIISSVTPGLKIYGNGKIFADSETNQTSIKKVYAGGDAVTGAATVISAMEAGKKAALAIDKYFKNEPETV